MRLPVLILALILAAAPAEAETVAPAGASAHVGQTVTIKGTVENVHTTGSGMTFFDMGGRFPENAFTGVIFASDAGKFPKAGSLAGKTVEITGPVELYKGKPEIILKEAGQLKVE